MSEWIQRHSFGGFDDGHIEIRRQNALVFLLDLECIPEEESKSVKESELKSELIRDLVKLCEEAPFSDLTFVVGQGRNQKTFKAHKGMLVTRSLTAHNLLLSM